MTGDWVDLDPYSSSAFNFTAIFWMVFHYLYNLSRNVSQQSHVIMNMTFTLAIAQCPEFFQM